MCEKRQGCKNLKGVRKKKCTSRGKLTAMYVYKSNSTRPKYAYSGWSFSTRLLLCTYISVFHYLKTKKKRIMNSNLVFPLNFGNENLNARALRRVLKNIFFINETLTLKA